MSIPSVKKPILYFLNFEGQRSFHLCSQKFGADSDFWEKNNIELEASRYSNPEVAFQILSNIFAQAGIVLLKD